MDYKNDKLYQLLTPDVQAYVDAIVRVQPDFFQELINLNREHPGMINELISPEIVREYRTLIEKQTDDAARDAAETYALAQNMHTEIDTHNRRQIMNALLSALQPFQAQKFITIMQDSYGLRLKMNKNCTASNSRIAFFRNKCCKTVIGFITQFNSAITRVYTNYGIDPETPLVAFFEQLHIDIPPNFFDACANQPFTDPNVSLFLRLTSISPLQFKSFTPAPAPPSTLAGGYHTRYFKRRSRRSMCRKMRKTHKRKHVQKKRVN
jgi:hypothetical protein